MNNDYSLNNDDAGKDTRYWYQKTRIYKVITNPIFIVRLILFIGIIVVIYWNYIRPRQFKTIYKKTTTICRVQILSSVKPGTRTGNKRIPRSYAKLRQRCARKLSRSSA